MFTAKSPITCERCNKVPQRETSSSIKGLKPAKWHRNVFCLLKTRGQECRKLFLWQNQLVLETLPGQYQTKKPLHKCEFEKTMLQSWVTELQCSVRKCSKMHTKTNITKEQKTILLYCFAKLEKSSKKYNDGINRSTENEGSPQIQGQCKLNQVTDKQCVVST